MKLKNYYHTLKYLKISQIYYRIQKRFSHPTVNKVCCGQSDISGNWISHGLYEQKLFLENCVRFLNADGCISSVSDWNDPAKAKLWLYNLHYFDDLNAIDADSRTGLHIELIDRWISENPAPLGNGWEPYPTSLRIVNWVKAFLSGLPVEQNRLDSLATQADYLSQDLEQHILGNHLFVNAKALIFAGCYLEGKDSDSWLKTGLSIYSKELDEQVLPDGGNFELTPMYHVIMLVDLLDLFNLFTVYSHKVNPGLLIKTKEVAIKMLHWMQVMSHSDGEISFFNDSTFSIAPKNAVVFEYAAKLGIIPSELNALLPDGVQLYDLIDSGYVSAKTSEYSLIADLSAVGPDYIPGHGHADTLSFEFALKGQRIFVNSGISEYGLSDERLRQRGTAAHNTVIVNGLDSSVVWSGFRVAQRARINHRVIEQVKNKVGFSASHNGFKQQGINCIHQRSWSLNSKEIRIIDKLKGEFNTAIASLHLHPDVVVETIDDDKVVLSAVGFMIVLRFSGASILLEDTSWHPEFGVSLPSKKLCCKFLGSLMTVDISWSRS
ncbi:MAG: alginate lyase family protein [Cycloclasticus sp.]